MKLSMSRADIIKEGRLSKPWKYFDVAWNSSSSKYNIDGLYGFQSFPRTVKSSLKNQSIEVRRIQRLAFFFSMSNVFEKILQVGISFVILIPAHWTDFLLGDWTPD